MAQEKRFSKKAMDAALNLLASGGELLFLPPYQALQRGAAASFEAARPLLIPDDPTTPINESYFTNQDTPTAGNPLGRRTIQNPFMSEEKLTRLSDPRLAAMDTLRTLIGLGAYAIPGGKFTAPLGSQAVGGQLANVAARGGLRAGMLRTADPEAGPVDIAETGALGALLAPVLALGNRGVGILRGTYSQPMAPSQPPPGQAPAPQTAYSSEVTQDNTVREVLSPFRNVTENPRYAPLQGYQPPTIGQAPQSQPLPAQPQVIPQDAATTIQPQTAIPPSQLDVRSNYQALQPILEQVDPNSVGGQQIRNQYQSGLGLLADFDLAGKLPPGEQRNIILADITEKILNSPQNSPVAPYQSTAKSAFQQLTGLNYDTFITNLGSLNIGG